MSINKKRDQSLATIVHTDAASDWALTDDRIPVFTIVRPFVDDGEPKPEGWVEPEPETIVYTMPRKPNPGIALRFLKMARTMGDAASSWLIETAIGEEGYDALADELINYDGDPQELLQAIAEKIQKVVMGGLDAGPKA